MAREEPDVRKEVQRGISCLFGGWPPQLGSVVRDELVSRVADVPQCFRILGILQQVGNGGAELMGNVGEESPDEGKREEGLGNVDDVDAVKSELENLLQALTDSSEDFNASVLSESGEEFA